MDRIKIKCVITDQELELQLDRKAMPGEAGPCFMITAGGCFKGYITRQKNGSYTPLGTPYYTNEDFQLINDQLSEHTR